MRKSLRLKKVDDFIPWQTLKELQWSSLNLLIALQRRNKIYP